MGKKTAKRAAAKAQAQQAEQAAKQQAAAKKAAATAQPGAPKQRNKPAIIISIVVIALIGGIVIAAGIQAQSQPGAPFDNDRGSGMLLGSGEPKATATIAIVLKEGESPDQAVTPLLGPLKNVRGVHRGIVLKDGSAVEITYDPELITEAEITTLVQDAGYLRE